MATQVETRRHAETTDGSGVERERELNAIDDLIGRCKDRLSGVSDKLLSSATKSGLVDMYRGIRADAENDELRTERLQWMRDNVSNLQETIVKAASQRERFEADLTSAVSQKWLSVESADRWMRRFEDPDLLEMYRSAWLKNEWEGFKTRWKGLAADRKRVLDRAAAQGVKAKDVPELATLSKDDAFLSDRLSYHERRSMVDAAAAAVEAVGTGLTVELRKTEAILLPASKGSARYLHPGKVGQWMQRAVKSGDPVAFREGVIKPFMKNWRAARERYDGLAKRYHADGQPDGCAPMGLNAFLEGSFDARSAVLEEWENRLDAAARLRSADASEFDKDKMDIRRSVDLKDFDVAQRKLDEAFAEHPDDKDLQSIAAHLAAVRAEIAKEKEEETAVHDRTAQALEGLRAMQKGVPSALSKHYAQLLENGDAEAAATFFMAMKVRADRRKSGETTDKEEYLATLKAEEAEEATVVEATTEQEVTVEAPAEDETPTVAESPDTDAEREASPVIQAAPEQDDVELIVTKDTPPSETLALLRSHGASRAHRSPALVVEGMPFEQQLQMVELNTRFLAHMRHLDSVGQPYTAKQTTAEALAA
jgi:hypothetical protein